MRNFWDFLWSSSSSPGMYVLSVVIVWTIYSLGDQQSLEGALSSSDSSDPSLREVIKMGRRWEKCGNTIQCKKTLRFQNRHKSPPKSKFYLKEGFFESLKLISGQLSLALHEERDLVGLFDFGVLLCNFVVLTSHIVPFSYAKKIFLLSFHHPFFPTAPDWNTKLWPSRNFSVGDKSAQEMQSKCWHCVSCVSPNQNKKMFLEHFTSKLVFVRGGARSSLVNGHESPQAKGHS